MRVARSSRARAGCVSGCLIRLMAVALVAGLLALIVFTVILVRNRQTAPVPGSRTDPPVSQRVALGPAIVVPPGAERSGGLLVYTAPQGSPGAALSYLDGDPLALRWNTGTLSDDSARWPPALAADTVYFGDGLRLVAVSLPDGDRRWSAELSAALPAGCTGCIQPLDGAVAVLTEDQALSVLSAENGDLLWQTTLHALPREVLVIGGSPAVVDTLPVTDSSALLVFDPLTGSERYRILPRCEFGGSAETLSPGSPLLHDAASGALYFLFGFEQHGCAQRWDAVTGQMVWSVGFPLDTSGWPRTWPLSGPLLGGGAIYFAGDDGASILRLDTADGSLRTLHRSATYTLDPWALEGDTLLAHTELLDNLENDELWGIDTGSGKQLWRYPITHDNSSWTAHRAANAFAAIQLLPDPPRLYAALLDRETGEPLRTRTLPLDSAAWTGSAWTDDAAWLTIGALYTVDLSTGIPAQVWPAP